MSRRIFLPLFWVPLALALTACGDEGVTTPTPTPTPTPTGTFSVVSVSPSFGATVSGSDSDLQGILGLEVTFQMSYPQSISDIYFVLELRSGTTECLRSQIAYTTRPDGGPFYSYPGGTTATYRTWFFVRDNQQAGCGARFATDRMRFVLQDRSAIDPTTGQPRTLFTQEESGGWAFEFAR